MATHTKTKIVLFLLILCAVGAVAWSALSHKKGVAKTAQDSSIPVRVQKVKPQDLQEILEYVGDIKACEEAVVYPKVGGKIIEKVKQEGDPVQKGEAIIFVDRDQVGLKFEKAPVESPLSGTVGRIYVDIGTTIFAQTALTSETAQTAVALVVNMDKMKIDLNIPEKYLPHIQLDQEAIVAVDAYPKETFSGRVTMISPVLDLQTRSAPIEITLENPSHRLKSGMFAKVRLVLETHQNVLAILKEAIIGKGENSFVYVVEANKAVLRQVSLGMRQGPYFEVLDGLKDGDRVVIMGQQRLYDDASVTIESDNGSGRGGYDETT